jgi:uncharacterized membrane protein YdjX (TVP38/TMEM64 family)
VISGVLFWLFAGVFSLENLKTQRQLLLVFFDRHPAATAFGFCAAYILFSALALPVATILSLTGGAIFGLFWGTVFVLFSSAVGATLACAFSRLLFRDEVQRRYGDKLRVWTRNLKRDGPLFLFSLRLVPFVPFALINLLMGLLPITFFMFFWVTIVGMAPATVLYVNAGTHLSEINSLRDVLSPEILVSLLLIGLLPWTAKKITDYLKRRRI